MPGDGDASRALRVGRLVFGTLDRAGLLLVSVVWLALALHEDVTGSPRLNPVWFGWVLSVVDGAVGVLGIRANARARRLARNHDDQDTAGDAPAPAGDPSRRAAAALEIFNTATRALDPVPELVLVRPGPLGVELLLAAPRGEAPAPFRAVGDGAVWLLPTASEPGDRDAPEDAGAAVTLLGTDTGGAYFAPATLDTDDAPSGITVVESGAGVFLEPYGLWLDDSTDGPVTGDEGVDEEVADPLDSCAGDGFAEEWPASSDEVPSSLDEPGTSAGGPTSAVPPGVVEVRILREEPDLVGAVVEEPSAAAVEFVAYLATHRHKATTARLQDSLGTARSVASRSTKTVWSAAGAARRCLGEELVPAAAGNQVYVLGDAVTCDWARFQELVRVADTAENDEVARTALTEALALVGGVPGLTSRRFGWLDTEGILTEITHAVVETACRLARLEATGVTSDPDASTASLERARRALAVGRILSPHAPEIDEVEHELATVRGQERVRALPPGNDEVASGPLRARVH